MLVSDCLLSGPHPGLLQSILGTDNKSDADMLLSRALRLPSASPPPIQPSPCTDGALCLPPPAAAFRSTQGPLFSWKGSSLTLEYVLVFCHFAKYRRRTMVKEKDLVWLSISEVLVHDCMGLWRGRTLWQGRAWQREEERE